MVSAPMTSAERVGLVRALQKHPRIRDAIGEPWRVKRLEPAELRRLAARLGVDQAPIDARVREVSRAALTPPGKVETRAQRRPHPGAFKGTIEFPLSMDLLGQKVVRRARLTFGYTPEWDYCVGGRIADGGPEAYSFIIEVSAVPDRGGWQVGTDGALRRPPQSRWATFNLLDDGILPESVIEHFESLIDDDARRQDADRREMAAATPLLNAQIEQDRRARLGSKE
jgi:hypothetical protein